MTLVAIGMFVAAFLEMLGIGAIPGFVALLSNPDTFISKLPDGPAREWVTTTDPAMRTLYGAGLLATVFLFKNAFAATLVVLEAHVLRDATTGLATRLFSGYMGSPYTFHLQRNPAQLIRNVTAEVVNAVALLANSILVARETLVLIVVFLLLLIVDPLVSLVAFVVLGTAAGGFYATVRETLLRRSRAAQAYRGKQLQTVNQALGAIKDAKVLGREPYLVNTFRAEAECIQHHAFYQKIVAALPRLFLEVLAVSSIVVVAVTFVMLGRSIVSMLPVLALLAVGAVRLVPAFNTISASMVLIRGQQPSVELIRSELALFNGHADMPERHAGDSEEFPSVPTERIDFEQLRYRYPNASRDALNGVSATVAAGEAIGFIGPSGSGKSTLIDLLLGLLKPTAGQVRLNGRSIEEDMSCWQRRIGYIPQDIYLIDDTIARNVAFGIPDDQIDAGALSAALTAAQLDGFVESLPEGVETMVGNRGVRLSGGQRQRIGIARALYHNPEVLVMDEATSALDNETERAVVESINELRGDRTLVIIAHRLNTVANCDCLYLLRDGEIVDSGKFDDLLRRHPDLRENTSSVARRAVTLDAPAAQSRIRG